MENKVKLWKNMSSAQDLDQLGLDIIEQDAPILLDDHQNDLGYATGLLKKKSSKEYVFFTPRGAEEKVGVKNVGVKMSWFDEKAGILRFDAMKKKGWRRRLVPLGEC